MNKLFFNFFISFIAVLTGLQAQNLSGTVTDSEDGEPLVGVNTVSYTHLTLPTTD